MHLCSNPWVVFSYVGNSFWSPLSASQASGAFGGKAIPWPRFCIIESSSSSSWTRLAQTLIIASLGSYPLLLPEFNMPEQLSVTAIYSLMRCLGVQHCKIFVVCPCLYVHGMTFPTLFHIGTLNGIKEVVMVAVLSCVYSCFHRSRSCGVSAAICKHFCFSNLGHNINKW